MKDTYTLVYQCGLANVFRHDGAKTTRVLQHAFSECESFARGLREAGAIVNVSHCDEAGDIRNAEWITGAGDMFSESKHFA